MTKIQPVRKVLHAIILAVYTAGSLHLIIAGVAAIVRRDISLFNPINILGLNLLFPELSTSVPAMIIGWIALIGLGFVYLFLLIHYKRYLAIISSSSPYEKLRQVRQIVSEMPPAFTSQRKVAGQKRAVYVTKIRERLAMVMAVLQDDDNK